jgi:nucleotide-binding universal stress UspA family protein
MTYRSIFVHNDDSPDMDRRIDIAIRLAKAFPAELVGTFLVPGFNPPPLATAMLASEIAQQSRRDTVEDARAAEARFRAAGASAGIAKVTWRTPKTDPFDAAVLEARYCDITVLGQPSQDHPSAAFNAELANAVLMLSGRPVLFVPFAGMEKTLGQRILIAWKDSRESARAVADALPLLKDASKVYALAVTAEHDDSRRELLADRQLHEFLGRHNVDATVKRVVAPDIDAGELLLSQAADVGADLIVMGGYSRPRITQLVWGGVTRLMLQSMTVPVLMSH